MQEGELAMRCGVFLLHGLLIVMQCCKLQLVVITVVPLV